MTRRLPLAIGVSTLAVVWFGPLDAILPGGFSAHMTRHMGVVAVAAPLLALGIAGSRFDPVCSAPALFPPVPLSLVELVAVWAWHAPALHQWARVSPEGLLIEQSSFLVTGLLVWLAAFGGREPPWSGRRAAGLVALLLTSMHMTLLGALLALPPRALYVHAQHSSGGDRVASLEDQHVGGAIMLLVGGISYIAGGISLASGLLKPRFRSPMASSES